VRPYINSSGLLLSVCVSVCVCVCVPFPWQTFTKLFILVSFFSLSSRNTSLHHSSETPPLLVSRLSDWHAAAAYLPQLCVFCAPWFSALSSSLSLSLASPFLGRLIDVAICCLSLPSTGQSSPPPSRLYEKAHRTASAVHGCSGFVAIFVTWVYNETFFSSLLHYLKENSPEQIRSSVVRNVIPYSCIIQFN